MQDYYKILNIRSSATDFEIKKAYRKLAKLNHPDTKDPEQREVYTQRMKEINEAYHTLGDENRRSRYDRDFKSTSQSTGTEYRETYREDSKESSTQTQKKEEHYQKHGESVAYTGEDIYTLSDEDLKKIGIVRILLGKKYAHVKIPSKYMFTDLNYVKKSRKVSVNPFSFLMGKVLDVIHNYLWWVFSFDRYKAMVRIFMLIVFLIVTNIPAPDYAVAYIRASTMASNFAIVFLVCRLVYVLYNRIVAIITKTVARIQSWLK